MTNQRPIKQVLPLFRAIEPCSGEYATGETFIGDGKGGIAIGDLNSKYFCEVTKETLQISLDGVEFHSMEELKEALIVLGNAKKSGDISKLGGIDEQ